jgi:hypothetical protein
VFGALRIAIIGNASVPILFHRDLALKMGLFLRKVARGSLPCDAGDVGAAER